MKRKRKTTGRHHGMQAFTLCISTTMVLILLGMVVLSVLTARNLTKYVKENMAVNLILGDTVTVAQGLKLADTLRTMSYARKVRYISSEEALVTMTNEMGANPMEFAGQNPFQAEIEVLLNASYANADSLRLIGQQMKEDSRVFDISYLADQIDDVDRTVQRINLFLLILAALHIFICFTLVNNSVQLGIYSRRFNIHTMKLVGAKWSFIRRPFLIKGVAIGLVASILACVALGSGYYVSHEYELWVRLFISQQDLIITAAAIFAFGFVIMLLCTLLSVNRFLRMTAGELYKI
jgi:cell division transport system permease protein